MLAVLNGGEVARRLGVTRTTVSDWAHLADPPPARVVQVRELLLEALGRKEAAPPDDPMGRLDAKVTATQEAVERIGEMLAALAASLGSSPSLPPGGGSADAQAGTRPRDKRGR